VYGLLSIDNLCGAQAVFPVGTGLSSIHEGDDEQSRERRRKIWTVVGGLFSIMIAAVGIVGKIEAWLIILGTIFSPIIGTVLANQYFVKKDFSNKKIYIPAIASWLLGCGVSFVSAGIPILQALVAALASFVAFNKRLNKNN
jgi:purine-cytosine permease-like protein